ncbi:unnamed protein product [Rotaria magnacalcarata]
MALTAFIVGSPSTGSHVGKEKNLLLVVSRDPTDNNSDAHGDNIEIITGIRPQKRFSTLFSPRTFVWLAVLVMVIISISIIVIAYTKGKTTIQGARDKEGTTSDNTSSTVTFRPENITIQQLTKKVLFIIADGIPADVIEAASVTNIRKISDLGAYKRAYVGGIKGSYSETPTISAPGYMDLITGTWGNKHNVFDNDVKSPNYHYKNIFRLLKEQEPQKEIGIFSTWLDNRLKLVGEGLPQAGQIIFDYKFDGYELNQSAYQHDLADYYIHRIDERVTNETATCIRTAAPDLSWVYLQYTDDVAHHFGDSEQFNQSVISLDNQIGRMWEAIEYRQNHFHEDWLIIITTDHGRDPTTGREHGHQSDRERTTWIVINTQNTNDYFRNFQPAIVDLLPTMAQFLSISIPIESARELDGISLIGKISIANFEAQLTDDRIELSWQAFDDEGNVTIWLSTTNLFQKGESDYYQLMGTEPIALKVAEIDVKNYPSKFYKIVLEGRYNMVNKWLFRLN